MLHSVTARRVLAASALFAIPALSASYREVAAIPPAAHRFHIALKRAQPGVNDTIGASPKTIKLWFTESVGAASTSIRVTGPSEQTVAIGPVTVEEAPLSPAVVTVAKPLTTGTYVVEWRAMAADGHPSGGKFSFILRPAGST